VPRSNAEFDGFRLIASKSKARPVKEAKFELEAMLINELTELKNTEVYFVVGVPHFYVSGFDVAAFDEHGVCGSFELFSDRRGKFAPRFLFKRDYVASQHLCIRQTAL
jgi:hypothetical protein